MIKEAIVKIVNKEDLTYKEAYDVMNEIMNGETLDGILVGNTASCTDSNRIPSGWS